MCRFTCVLQAYEPQNCPQPEPHRPLPPPNVVLRDRSVYGAVSHDATGELLFYELAGLGGDLPGPEARERLPSWCGQQQQEEEEEADGGTADIGCWRVGRPPPEDVADVMLRACTTGVSVSGGLRGVGGLGSRAARHTLWRLLPWAGARTPPPCVLWCASMWVWEVCK